MGSNSMEWKDIALIAGVRVTFLLGIANLAYSIRWNRRAAFINAVTSERVKWIGKLRENISRYVGLTHYWFVSKRDVDPQKLEDILQDLRVLRYHITLQLNPKPEAQIDQRIMQLVREIPDDASKSDMTPLLNSLDELVAAGQQLLKAEWDKVKREAQKGALADVPPITVQIQKLTQRSKSWAIAGLILTLVGAGLGVYGVRLIEDQAVEIGVMRINGNNSEEDMTLPAVRNLLRQSRFAQAGFVLIFLGTACQIVSVMKKSGSDGD
jgi:hypothetical protein